MGSSNAMGGCDSPPYQPLGDYEEGTVRVEMFRLGEGCSENCASCGAYPAEKDPGDLCAKEVSGKRIRDCINAILRSTSNAVFPSYVTTDVQQEPLNGDAFLNFMQMIKRLTNGRTRAICISHGLRATREGRVVNSAAEERLRKIAEFMDERDVFVLSFDTMRSNAMIGDNENVASYIETLDGLKFAVRRGVRVTISIQGVDGVDPGNPNYAYSRKRAQELLAVVIRKLREEKKWTLEEIGSLVKDESRRFVRIGRAAREFPWLDPAGETTVIPDSEIITRLHHEGFLSHTLRARMDCISGRLEAQVNNPLRSYRDTIRGRWGNVPLGYPVRGRATLRAVRRGVKRTVAAEVWDKRMDAQCLGRAAGAVVASPGEGDVLDDQAGSTASGVAEVVGGGEDSSCADYADALERDFAGEQPGIAEVLGVSGKVATGAGAGDSSPGRIVVAWLDADNVRQADSDEEIPDGDGWEGGGEDDPAKRKVDDSEEL